MCPKQTNQQQQKLLKTHTMSSQEECPCARTFIEMSWISLCTAWTLTSSVQLFVSVSPFYLVIESGMVLSFGFFFFSFFYFQNFTWADSMFDFFFFSLLQICKMNDSEYFFSFYFVNYNFTELSLKSFFFFFKYLKI